MNESVQIDQSIKRMADQSARLSETVAELTIAFAELIRQEAPIIEPLHAFKIAGDIIADFVARVPLIVGEIAKSHGATMEPGVVTRQTIDDILRQQDVIDSLADGTIRAARKFSRDHEPDYVAQGEY